MIDNGQWHVAELEDVGLSQQWLLCGIEEVFYPNEIAIVGPRIEEPNV